MISVTAKFLGQIIGLLSTYINQIFIYLAALRLDKMTMTYK